jgi:hypothetical protein
MDSPDCRNVHHTEPALSQLHSPYWLLFTAFVGVNLFQPALTRWCLMEDVLRKLGVPEGGS